MEDKIHWYDTWKGFIVVLLIFGAGYLWGYNFNLNCECSGIGGFVYKEIEWQEQTINVIKENCNYGIYINDWEEEGVMFLQCPKDVCKGEYCKTINWKSPIRTPIE